MDILSLVIGCVCGALITFIILWLIFERRRGIPKEEADRMHAQIASLQLEKGRSEERASLLTEQLSRSEEDLAAERSALSGTRSALATAETEFKNAQEKLLEQKAEVQSLQDQFTAAFRNLANDILSHPSHRRAAQSVGG